MPELFVLPPRERSLEHALELSGYLLARARVRGAPLLASSLVRANALVLGGRQSRPHVSAGQVLRRRTLGTTARVFGRAIWHALALPRPDALARDGTPANVLNRNLRGFVTGYSSGGLASSYPGREFLSFARRPCALVGYDVDADLATLIEVAVGLDAPVLVRVSEGRQGGARESSPASYGELAGDEVDFAGLAARVEQAFARRFDCLLRPEPEPEGSALASYAAPEPPAGPSIELGAREVPLGQLRAVMYGRTFRVEGELLGSSAGLERFEEQISERVAAGVSLGPDLLDVFAQLPVQAVRADDLLALASLAERSAREPRRPDEIVEAPPGAADPEQR